MGFFLFFIVVAVVKKTSCRPDKSYRKTQSFL